MNKEDLLILLDDQDVQAKILGIIEEQLGDLVGLREYLDKTLDR